MRRGASSAAGGAPRRPTPSSASRPSRASGRWGLSLGAALLLGALALAVAPPARASHYRLATSGIVSRAELTALQAAGVQTTADLLERTAPRRARVRLARATKLSAARLTELATQCDLLRVRGVGPTMMRLLQASGVRHTGLLSKATAASLRAKMGAANKLYRLTEVLPDEATVGDWIQQARALPRLLEGVR